MNTSKTKTFYQFKNTRTMKLMPIAILLALICLNACTKNKTTIIEGNVLEYGSDKPIEGAKVEIYRWFSNDAFSGGSEFVDTVFTDSQGHFKWESDENIGDHWYEIRYIIKENYFPLRWKSNYLYYDHIKYRGHYNKTMHLDPHAYLHLHVEDVPEVEGSYVRFGGWVVPGIYSVELGENEIYDKILLAKGNKEDDNIFYYRFDKEMDLLIDTLFIPAHDTLYYHLKY